MKKQCPSCSECFTRQSSLGRHVANVHQASTTARSHVCDRCDKLFSRRDTLERHRRQHEGKDNEACRYCSRTYRKDYAVKHARLCGEKPSNAAHGPPNADRADTENAVTLQGDCISSSPKLLQWHHSMSQTKESERAFTDQSLRETTSRSVRQPVRFVHHRPFMQKKARMGTGAEIYKMTHNGDPERLKPLLREAEDLAPPVELVDGLMGKIADNSLPPITAAAGHAHITQIMSNPRLDVDKRDAHRRTPLHWACTKGDFSFACTLLAEGANVNAVDFLGDSPLHLALLHRQTSMAAILISYGANVDARHFYSGVVPLSIAAKNRDADSISLLLDSGANINPPPDDTGRILLCEAVDGGGILAVETLLARGVAVNVAEYLDPWTPLCLACSKGDAWIASALLDAGADVNYGSPPPLQRAERKGHYHVALILLEAGARHEKKAVPILHRLFADPLPMSTLAFSRNTSREYASDGPSLSTVEDLMVDKDRNTKKFQSSFDLLIETVNGARESAEQLDGLCRHRWGLGIISLIVKRTSPSLDCTLETHSKLLSFDFDINMQGANGWSALHYASECINLGMMKLLLDAGADIDLEGISTRTAMPTSPLDLVMQAGSEPAMCLLLERGATVRGGAMGLLKKACRSRVGKLLLYDKRHGLTGEGINATLKYAMEVGDAEMVRLIIEANAPSDALYDMARQALRDFKHMPTWPYCDQCYEREAKLRLLERYCEEDKAEEQTEQEQTEHTVVTLGHLSMDGQANHPIVVDGDNTEDDRADDSEDTREDYEQCCIDPQPPTDDTDICPQCDRTYWPLQ